VRLVLAQMKHETNTFSPVPTPLARFAHGRERPWEGREALEEFRGTGTALGAFIELAERAGAEIVLPVAAQAWPSGRVSQDAYELIAGKIVDAVKQGCDAVLLDLHGAMVTERLDDGEGELLARIRRVAPRVPIGVAHDMHANVFPATARVANSLAGYQTYPHVDMHGTGIRAGQPILGLLKNELRPVVAFGHKPMLPHVMRQSSLDSPNREIQARAQEMEREGVLSASFFVGFPHADIPYAGVSAVVTADGDAELARRCCDELLEMAWASREKFVYRPEPLHASMERAKSIQGRKPVVLLDHYDNCASGGTMDTTTVLEAILESRLEDVAAFALCDPAAVAQMKEAGLGANVTLALGGKADMPSLGLKGRPLMVTGTVKRIAEGRFRNEGPMGHGALTDMGATAVLDTGRVEIVAVSRQVEPYDIGAWRHIGIDPAAKRFVMLKSRVHWRAGLGDLAAAVVECAGTGVCTSDYSQLQFKRVRRPVYPLDEI
jgi:microcystin degradation protein MlrC